MSGLTKSFLIVSIGIFNKTNIFWSYRLNSRNVPFIFLFCRTFDIYANH